MLTTFGIGLGTFATSSSSDDSAGTADLRQIKVYPDRSSLTDASLATIEGATGVEFATPFVRVTAGLNETGDDVSLIGITQKTAPKCLASGGYGPFSADARWVVLPAEVGANAYADKINNKIDLTVTSALGESAGTPSVISLDVTGTCDASYQVDAVNAAYVPLDYARELYLDRLGIKSTKELDESGGYEMATVQVKSQRDIEPVLHQIQSEGFQAVSRAQELNEVPGVIQVIRLATYVLAGTLLILSVFATALVTVGLMRQRTRELGILRAVGWRSGRVARLWVVEFLIAAVSSVGLGLVTGLLLSATIARPIRDQFAPGLSTGMHIPWIETLAALALLLGLCTAAGFWSIARATRRDIGTLMRSLM